jgi:hypothetical protein
MIQVIPWSENGADRCGTTAQRPTNANVGAVYFDTTIGKLLVFNASGEWVQPDGLEPEATSSGAAAGTGVAADERGARVQTTVLTIEDLEVTMTDATTNGSHGSQKVYDFPAGNIMVLGAVTDLTIEAGAGGISDTASIVASVGSAAVGTDNATLTSTEANIVPSTAGTLTSGAGAVKGESTAVALLDGTSTAADAYLNIACPDAGSSANDTITVNGTIRLIWINLGDN